MSHADRPLKVVKTVKRLEKLPEHLSVRDALRLMHDDMETQIQRVGNRKAVYTEVAKSLDVSEATVKTYYQQDAKQKRTKAS